MVDSKEKVVRKRGDGGGEGGKMHYFSVGYMYTGMHILGVE